MSCLRLEKVTKVYGKGEQAFEVLNDISFSVDKGTFVAIVGPSGSGKSTFLSLAGALLSPTDGKIFLNNQDITVASEKELNQIRLNQIGFVFQQPHLVPYLTVEEQLMLIPVLAKKSKAEGKEKMRELLVHLEMIHRQKHYPNELSGGERQRIAIARAFMNDPDIILADEPTASLDAKRGRDVVELLANEVRKRNKAAIMVTHDERMLDLCDRIIMIEDGVLKDRRTVLMK